MSHKQATSPSAVPFSWETLPGVPKLKASPVADSIGGIDQEVSKKALTPPPPPPPPPPVSHRGPMKRSMSSRVFWREEDPFLAALKECSKDYNGKGDMKKRFGIWGSKSFLWCRCSFDVEEGNLRGRARALPSTGGPVIPRERVQSLIRLHKGLRK
ncbi:hypothetical protein L1887_36111 [Cichorium endivia]|nr:hypothetical protein L1887_36111 [Cichorium endivia]